MNGLARLSGWWLDLLFPKTCFGCDTEGVFLCDACRGSLERLTPSCRVCSKRNFTALVCDSCRAESSLRRFVAPFSYRQPLARELIHAYKYDGVRELAGVLADEIAGYLAANAIPIPQSSLLVPIPLARSRERDRGFNQAELLGRELASRIGLAMSPALLRRRATDPQVEMDSFASRRANVADAFRVRDPEAIRGRRLVLVDDVSTSGATLDEAARVLREAGCRTVSALVVAKG